LKIIAQADQSGLTFPDRDYYTRTEEESKALRDSYTAHIARMFELLGDSAEQAAAESKVVLEIETHLAEASLTNVELRNPDTQYHILDLGALAKLTPHFSWPADFKVTGHPAFTSLNVGQLAFFKDLDQKIASRSLDGWKAICWTAWPRDFRMLSWRRTSTSRRRRSQE